MCPQIIEGNTQNLQILEIIIICILPMSLALVYI